MPPVFAASTTRRLARLVCALGVAASAPVAAAADAAAGTAVGPAGPGRYAATLCVAAAASALPSCGAAEFIVLNGSQAQVRVSDIVYRLRLRPPRLEVLTMHGKMLIDEFSADYRWNDAVLRFDDPDKGARYEVKIGARRSDR